MTEPADEKPDGLTPDETRIRHLFELMLAGADDRVRDVARRYPGLSVRPTGDTPLEGEWELFLIDRDNGDEVVPVGVFSSLQVRAPQRG
jgi:hypothetical protein